MSARSSRALSALEALAAGPAALLALLAAGTIARGPTVLVPVLEAMEARLAAFFARFGLYVHRLWLDWDPSHPASAWLIAGGVASLGAAASCAAAPPGSRLRIGMLVTAVGACAALIAFTPSNVYRWPVSALTRAFYCVPALALVALLSTTTLVERVRGATTSPAPRLRRAVAWGGMALCAAFFALFG